MSVEAEILVTGIKVVDLLAPYAKGGKIGKIQNERLYSDMKGITLVLSNVLVCWHGITNRSNFQLRSH